MSVYVCVFDVICFVDVLASQTGIVRGILCSNDHNAFSSSVGMSIK